MYGAISKTVHVDDWNECCIDVEPPNNKILTFKYHEVQH